MNVQWRSVLVLFSIDCFTYRLGNGLCARLGACLLPFPPDGEPLDSLIYCNPRSLLQSEDRENLQARRVQET